MTPGLTSRPIAELDQRLREIVTGDVSRKLQAVTTFLADEVESNDLRQYGRIEVAAYASRTFAWRSAPSSASA
jgi:hypothetical protein